MVLSDRIKIYQSINFSDQSACYPGIDRDLWIE